MSLTKLFNRIFWHNNTTPAINENNLNAMSKAIDDIDDRVIGLAGDILEVIPQIQTYLAQADDLVEAMENLSKHPPYIGANGNWYVWDTQTSAFVDSGIDASITVDIADVTMLAPTAAPYVTNTGTNTDPVFHLFIPRGKGISSITKTSTSGLVDTYTITYSDGYTDTFTVTNGKTAYQSAVEGGYQGTEAQFETDLGNFTTYASSAEQSAEDAEAYAVGTRNGTAVGSSDPTYHNNSKYYSEQSSDSATAAATSAGTAASEASDAEAYGAGTRNGVPVDSSDPAYHNNASYYASQAASQSLVSLTDVDIDDNTLANGDALVYNVQSNKWENGQVAIASKMDIDGANAAEGVNLGRLVNELDSSFTRQTTSTNLLSLSTQPGFVIPVLEYYIAEGDTVDDIPVNPTLTVNDGQIPGDLFEGTTTHYHYVISSANKLVSLQYNSLTGNNDDKKLCIRIKGNSYPTTASGQGSFATGKASVASNNCTTAEGAFSSSTGFASHAEGARCQSGGNGSHAEGYQTIAIGQGSHAEGTETFANYTGHAEGLRTIASGSYSHAEGYNTTASSTYSHAEGNSATASGVGAHAEGNSATASGTGAHAEGNLTTASGTYSHAEGMSSQARGDYSHVSGYGAIVNNKCQFVHANCNPDEEKFRNTSMPFKGNHAFGIDLSADEVGGTKNYVGDYGCEGTLVNSGSITIQIAPEGQYLLFISQYTISNGALYGAAVRFIVGGGTRSATPTSLQMVTSGTPPTVATSSSNIITITNGGNTRCSQYALLRIN